MKKLELNIVFNNQVNIMEALRLLSKSQYDYISLALLVSEPISNKTLIETVRKIDVVSEERKIIIKKIIKCSVKLVCVSYKLLRTLAAHSVELLLKGDEALYMKSASYRLYALRKAKIQYHIETDNDMMIAYCRRKGFLHIPADIDFSKFDNDDAFKLIFNDITNSDYYMQIYNKLVLDRTLPSCKYNSCLGHTLYVDGLGQVSFCPKFPKKTYLCDIKAISSFETAFDNDNFIELLKSATERRKHCLNDCKAYSICQGYCPLSNLPVSLCDSISSAYTTSIFALKQINCNEDLSIYSQSIRDLILNAVAFYKFNFFKENKK